MIGRLISTSLVTSLITCVTYAQPVISSFTPGFGPAGSTITITGSGFNATPSNNFVFFGSVRGGVSAGTTTSLTVNVPGGLTFEPVSVFDPTTKLTGFAHKPFVTTFQGSSTFSPSSFLPKKDFITGANVYGIAIGDLNLDQKPDIATVNSIPPTFSLLQNSSSTSSLNFNANVDFSTSPTGYLIATALADFDGDGRKDIAITDANKSFFDVLKNLTTSGNPLNFGNKETFGPVLEPYSLVTADFDLDGKIDVAVANQNVVSVFKNTTTALAISFASGKPFPAGIEVRGIAAADLDADGKVDIVVTNRVSGSISVLKNTSAGSISFAPKFDIIVGSAPESIAVGDLDGDDKIDVVVANNDAPNGTVSVLRNTTITGDTITFAPRQDLSAGVNPFSVAIADLNGDGKLDIGVANETSNSISLFSNASSPGTLLFNPKQDYATEKKPVSLSFGDFDLDGRIDMVVSNNGSNLVSVYLNNVQPCNSTALISGPACIGSTLVLSSDNLVDSVSWMLNGTVVATQRAGLQNVGKLAAGGNGAGSALNQLSSPNRLFVDKDGVLYIPDMGNNRIIKWLPGEAAGTVIAGGSGAGSGANQFDKPTCVALDTQGNLYVADQNNNRIQKWVPGASSGVTVISSLDMPTGIFIDSQNNLYVAEQGSYRVKKFAPGSSIGIVVAGGNGQGSAADQLASPTGLFVDGAGSIYICDTDNNRVQKWALGANSGITVAKGPGLTHPLGIYVDLQDNLYISDYTGGNVQRWTPGASSGSIIINSSSNMGAIKPQAVWIDPGNNLYVTDFTQHRVLKFENIFTGSYTVLKAGAYTASIASSLGCVVTSNSIIIPENPVTDVTVTTNTSIICPDITPVFTASIAIPGQTPLFQWKINGINSGVPAAATTFSPAGLKVGDKISCDISLFNSCGNSYQASGNTITMTDVTVGSSSITITASKIELCAGTEITFTSSVTGAGASPSYQWMLNGKPISGATASTYIVKSLVNSDKVSCEITSNELCRASTKALSNEVTLKVNPILIPEIVIEKNVETIYTGSPVTFVATVKNQGASPTFDWQINGKTVATNQMKFSTKELADGDQVTCILSSNATCASIASLISNAIDITVIKVTTINPPTAFTPNGDAVNDTWDIPGIMAFPENRVEIFNQYGTKVFNSRGYQTPWNGEFNGTALPTGVYYYVLKLDEMTRVSGSVTILR